MRSAKRGRAYRAASPIVHNTIHTHDRSCCDTYTHTNTPTHNKHTDAATAAYAAHQHEAERALAACRAYAARAREARFPTPQVLEVQVGGVGVEWPRAVLAWSYPQSFLNMHTPNVHRTSHRRRTTPWSAS